MVDALRRCRRCTSQRVSARVAPVGTRSRVEPPSGVRRPCPVQRRRWSMHSGASGVALSRPAICRFVFGPFHYCAFYERAAPDAPETIDDQRRSTGGRDRTICGGSRGSASLPMLPVLTSCERAAPDAPETIDDQRRSTGCRYRTICGGSRGSASLPAPAKWLGPITPTVFMFTPREKHHSYFLSFWFLQFRKASRCTRQFVQPCRCGSIRSSGNS